jgi:hypothetical protein
MNLETFRIGWDAALREARLLAHHDRAEDSIALETMARKYFVRLGLSRPRPAEPFLGSLELSWEWDALLSARTRTTEDDLLTELLGRDQFAPSETERPWLRVDWKLQGKLASDSPLLLSSADVWRSWVAQVTKRVAPTLPAPSSDPDRDAATLWWTGEPEASIRCGARGELWLLGVSLKGWQAIELPRQCDHPDDVTDDGPEAQLEVLAAGLAAALDAWNKALSLLLPARAHVQ